MCPRGHAAGADVLLADPVADGTALLAVIAKAGRVARRETPLGTNGTECLHLVWCLLGGGMVRVYKVYLPPGPAAEQRTCAAVQAGPRGCPP